MDPSVGREAREATRQHRSRPGALFPVLVTFDGDGSLADDLPEGPVELTLEATDANGELAPWLDDLWWTDVIRRWCDEPVVVRIQPTAGALLHPVVLCQVEMLRRVVPGWRTVAQAYVDDVGSEDGIQRMAAAAYHEVRFFDQRRPNGPVSKSLGEVRPIDELFGCIRIAQSRMYRATPVLVRLPAHRDRTRDDSGDDRSVERERVGDRTADVPGA